MSAKLVFLSLILCPVLAEVDSDARNVVSVIRCRSSCLDEFSHVIRTEDNCRKNSDCLMCWEVCQMLTDNFDLWNPMCEVPDICFPGCQKACGSINTQNNDSSSQFKSLKIRSVYEPSAERINLEWDVDNDLQGDGATLYAVLLKDPNQEWRQVAQTTSHVVYIRKNQLTRHTWIRLLAANSTDQICDSFTSFLDSFASISAEEAILTGGISQWKPQLESMEQSQMSSNIVATVTWPVLKDHPLPIKYEVSWNVIDESMEITGHLYTNDNIAVLTLWPDSLYSIQITSYSQDGKLHSRSEPLILYTRNSLEATTPEVICRSVTDGMGTLHIIASLAVCFMSLTLIVIYFWIHKRGPHGYAKPRVVETNKSNGRFSILWCKMISQKDKEKENQLLSLV